MASYMDKVKIDSAITDSTKFDLSCDHVTTSSFFAFNPVFIREMVPGEHIKINSEVFSRLQPLSVPTFGRCNINVRGFFVPMRTVWKYWNEFIVNTQSTIGAGSWSQTTLPAQRVFEKVPYITEQNIMDAILMQCDYNATDSSYPQVYGYMPWGEAKLSAHTGGDDFVFRYGTGGGGFLVYVQLNYYGRMAVKILESLGYKIPCYTSVTTPGTAATTGNGSRSISFMPILSLAKVYVDWYVNSQYYTTDSDIRFLEGFLNTVAPTDYSVSFQSFARILSIMLMSNYDSDIYVSAWDSPSGPNTGLYSALSFVDVTNPVAGRIVTNDVNGATSPTNATYRPVNGTPYVGGSTGGSTTASGVTTEYVLHALHSLTDYMKRHQLAGARVFDRYLARFGKVLNAEKLRRSIYLGTHQTGVQFGDVMSTGDKADLGSYAGKGLAYSKGDFEYSTDEYGYLILTSTIVPSAGYYQGIDRSVMHVTPTDFFTPEYDNLGVQSLSAAELYMSDNGSYDTGSLNAMYDQVFGYVPRYAEYKCSKDKLTGDFVRSTINTGLDAWHLFRRFTDTDFNNSSSNCVHSYDFTRGIFDGDQFNRIFKGWNSSTIYDMQDMFWLIYHFDIVDYAPMKSLYDTYEFEDSGKKVTLDVNGVEMN